MHMQKKSDLGGRIRQMFERNSSSLNLSAGVSSAPVLPAETRAAPRHPVRRKLWQLEDKMLCPIVGTCLSMDSLLALARCYNFTADRSDHFALHTETIRRISGRTAFTMALQKLLNRSYQATLKEFESARDDAAVRALWQNHLHRGNVAGALWAAATHPATRAETQSRIYGDIHMLSHRIGAAQSADLRRLSALELENVDLRRNIETQRQEQARREHQWRERFQARRENESAAQCRDQEMQEIKTRLERYESGVAMIEIGRKLMTLSAANEQLIVTAQKAMQIEHSVRTLKTELEETRRERDTLAIERKALESLLLDENAACDPICDDCDNNPVSSVPGRERRILCVGGRSQSLAHYRRLAQRLGIRLIHHDGGLEESLSRLPYMINGADAVICPTDCISHPAYYRLKNQCKRLGKPCLMFKGAGVSSFAAALLRLNAGEYSLGSATSGLSHD